MFDIDEEGINEGDSFNSLAHGDEEMSGSIAVPEMPMRENSLKILNNRHIENGREHKPAALTDIIS